MRSIFPLLPLLAIATPAAAAPFQNLEALESRLINALGAGVGEPGGLATPIDRRMKLATCPQPVTIDPPVMGAVALRCPAIGWRIRVPLQRLQGAAPASYSARAQGAGGYAAMAQPAAAKAAPVVRRGDPVDLIAETGGFSVSVTATAQEDGAPGSRIRVKTDKGDHPQGQILFAEVIDAGRVRLPGFN
ncbi:flagella basal body P-ring formation protein FlgA [Sphingomonas sp. BIUV-7]|uniref:Flagella basal body P-ring formation protein FlgA n=1 Tax=Sphingomonas natans TaxID=3063330 RepID=A0ABT8YDY1_9SPHN|nr:flagella basal body P-ring formation protein FlgA [Sphingomonas sp. BIUV-7]MDO6416558.1 flagella basal body P-ring formation protein FlgA [Sphingomonas sp. BIUV-7]